MVMIKNSLYFKEWRRRAVEISFSKRDLFFVRINFRGLKVFASPKTEVSGNKETSLRIFFFARPRTQILQTKDILSGFIK